MRRTLAIVVGCLVMAAPARAQSGDGTIVVERKWIDYWKKEFKLTEQEIRDILDRKTNTGVAKISKDYARGAAKDEARARRLAIAGLIAWAIGADEKHERDALAALRLLERFGDLKDERAVAPGWFADIAGETTHTRRIHAAVGGQLRALCRLGRMADARKALAAARKRHPDLTGWAQLEEEVRVREVRAILVPGKRAPELSGTQLDGGAFSLARARGQVVVVYFWSRTSRASVVRLQELNVLSREHRGSPLRVVGVAVDEYPKKLATFCRDWKVRFPQICEGKGWQSPAVRAWAVARVPRLWVIDKSGRVRHVDVKGYEPLRKAVVKLLAEKPAPAETPPKKKTG